MNHDDQPQDGMDPYDTEPGSETAHNVGEGGLAQTPFESGHEGSALPVPTAVFCVACGYNLTGVAIGSTCPECGRTVAPSFHGQMLPTSGKAIASLVLGVVSIVGCMMYGIPSLICGPLAIIFSRLARKQIDKGEAGGASAGMATAGIICGIIGVMMALAFWAMIVGVIILNR